MRHTLVVARTCFFSIWWMKKPNWWSQIIVLRLYCKFAYQSLKSRLSVLFMTSPAKKRTPTQNREAKPIACQTQLVSHWVLTQTIRFFIPCLLSMEHAFMKQFRDWLGKGWLVSLRHNPDLDPYILSVHPSHVSIKSPLLSRHHLGQSWGLLSKEVSCKMHRENGVHCVALYANPLKDAFNPWRNTFTLWPCIPQYRKLSWS